MGGWGTFSPFGFSCQRYHYDETTLLLPLRFSVMLPIGLGHSSCPRGVLNRGGDSLSGSSRVHHPPPWVSAEEDGCTSAEKRVFKNHPSLRKGGDFRHSSNSHKRKEGAMKKIMEIPRLHTGGGGRRRENSSPISPPLPFALLFKCTQRWEWVLGARFGWGEGGRRRHLEITFRSFPPPPFCPKGTPPPLLGQGRKGIFHPPPLCFRPTAIFSW